MGRTFLAAPLAVAALVALLLLSGAGPGRAALPAPVSQSVTASEDSSVSVTLAAAHNDGAAGCAELEFAAANVTGGALGAPSDRPCDEGSLLTEDVQADSDTIPLLTTAGFPESGTARIGDELVTYAALTENTLETVVRGVNGTTAAEHQAGALVSTAGLQTSTLAQNTSDVDVTVRLDGVALDFPAGGLLQIDDELIAYIARAEIDTGGSPDPDVTEFSGLARGALGTLAAAHVGGTRAFRPLSNQTALSEAVDAVQTLIPVDSTVTLVSPDGHVQVGQEVVEYTGLGDDAGDCGAVAPPCLTGVTRGALGSTATGHDVNTDAFQTAAADTDTTTVSFTPLPEYFSLDLALTSDIDSDDTVLPVTSITFLDQVLPLPGSVAINDEMITYSAIGDTIPECLPYAAPCLLGLARGAGGTAAAAHVMGTPVFQRFFTYTAGHNPVSGPVVAGINVQPVNDPPVAVDRSALVEPGSQQAILIEATDIDGDSGLLGTGNCELGFTVQTQPEHGTLGAVQNNPCVSVPPNTDANPNTDSASVLYIPDGGYSGPDSFGFMVCDDAACDTGTVTITVDFPSPTPTPSPSPTPPVPRADINCDGVIDAGDGLAIIRWYAGVPQETPVGCPEPDA